MRGSSRPAELELVKVVCRVFHIFPSVILARAAILSNFSSGRRSLARLPAMEDDLLEGLIPSAVPSRPDAQRKGVEICRARGIGWAPGVRIAIFGDGFDAFEADCVLRSRRMRLRDLGIRLCRVDRQAVARAEHQEEPQEGQHSRLNLPSESIGQTLTRPKTSDGSANAVADASRNSTETHPNRPRVSRCMGKHPTSRPNTLQSLSHTHQELRDEHYSLQPDVSEGERAQRIQEQANYEQGLGRHLLEDTTPQHAADRHAKLIQGSEQAEVNLCPLHPRVVQDSVDACGRCTTIVGHEDLNTQAECGQDEPSGRLHGPAPEDRTTTKARRVVKEMDPCRPPNQVRNSREGAT
mmetsp:Transcript_139254/g.445120  ORF Transcript_139254/g.445120 Transcript_139254/m.445120 type:complete len:352 (-) Transcript_139254:33-1088(-)